MTEDGESVISEEAVEHYKSRVEKSGAVRLRADELIRAFGLKDLAQETRESVADMLWDGGLRTEPALASAGIHAGSKLKLVPVDAAQVSAALSSQQPGPPAKFLDAQHAINPVGTAMTAVGGLLLALASFLPLDEPGGLIARVQSNTLIQHSEWWLLVCGATIVVAALRCYTSGRHKDTSSILVLGAIATGFVIYIAQNKGLRTLYPVGLSGEPEASASGTVVPLGIAVYVASGGVVLALLGGWMMRQTAEIVSAAEEEATRRCPDCAETILAAARVCKHCGARLDTSEPVEPDPVAPVPSSTERASN